MLISIDTYSENLGISLIDGHKLVVKQVYHKLKPFSELLMEKIDMIFNQLGYSPSILYAVSVNKGPGSYTGLRVGITVAKTISYSLNIPIYVFSSLEAMAYKYRAHEGNITVAINAGKGECYVADFQSNISDITQISEIRLMKINEFKKEIPENLVVVKNLDIHGNNIIQDIDDLSTEGAFFALKHHQKEDPMKLEPIYIRPL